jgi:DNA invertase Pin-like site-specific DNA recombinase
MTMIAYSYLRFSTPRQQWGDSQRRQSVNSAKYAEKMGLTLDAALRFWDRGVSGFHSKNLTEGALGRFLESIKTRKIRTPCALIVESLDRLSRDTLDEAFYLFLDLIRAGVVIHTLNPEVQYSRQSVKENPAHIMLAVNDLWRANRESETKSYRSRQNWIKKRQDARQKILTKRVPHWLEVVDEQICIKSGADRVIREMAQWAIDGMGTKKIAQRLNKANVPIFTNAYTRHVEDGDYLYRKALWDACYISTLLRNRALIGEMTPYQRTATGREQCAGPIPNYYPAILATDTFNRLQIALTARRGKVGRNGDKVANLFKGLLRDAIDKGTFYSNCKGKTAFLVNRSGSYGKGAFRSIRYDTFEAAFRRFIEVVRLTPNSVSNAPILEAAIAELDKRIEQAKATIRRHPNFTSLLETLVALETQRRDILEQLEAERNKTPGETALVSTRTIARDFNDSETRLRLRQRIAELVDSIWLLVTDNGLQKSSKVTNVHCQVFFKNGDQREFWLINSRAGGAVSFENLGTPTYDLRQYAPKTYARVVGKRGTVWIKPSGAKHTYGFHPSPQAFEKLL